MKKSKKSVISLICIALIILVLAAIFNKRDFKLSYVINRDMLQVPKIETYVKSSKDESPHYLAAEFYVDLKDKSQKDKLTSSELKSSITSIIRDIDYDELNKKGGLDDLRKKLKSELQNQYPDVPIKNVYVDSFITDFKISDTQTENSVNSALKRFQIK